MNPNNLRGKKPINLAPAPQTPKGRLARTIVFYILIILIGLIIFAAIRPSATLKNVSFSQLVSDVNAGKVSKVVESGQNLTIILKGQSSPTETSMVPQGASAAQQGLDISKVTYVAESADDTSNTLWNVAEIVIPIIVIVALFVWMMHSASAQGNQSLAFGRSKAKLYGKDKKSSVFADIAGNEEAKDDLMEVVDFLKYPKKFQSVGAKIPKGVLMVGPPGTGKTMLARAVAGEANVPFFSISGSEFVEMFVGVGASRVRDLFEKAKKNSPCIIFIDEIDAVGRRRGSGMGGGHDEREQTLNQILVEMDGFEEGQTVIVLAATNRADVLDPALLRPGRFDRRVILNLPERKDREAILKVHEKGKPIAKSVNLDALAAKSVGMSGADLANVMNEAAIRAARRNEKEITDDDVTAAFEKVSIGPERKNKVMNDADKALTAYHEGGHALVAQVLPDSDDVNKVTIIPRGGTGGVTWTIPAEDRPYTSVVELKDILARALGGRIAEEIVYGRDHVTTGASSDLRSATSIARDMIIEEGMGTKLRDQVFHEDEGGLMMDRIAREKPYSETTGEEIDREVNQLIEEAADRARLVISENREYLDKIKTALVEHETLDADAVKKLLSGAKLPDGAKLY